MKQEREACIVSDAIAGHWARWAGPQKLTPQSGMWLWKPWERVPCELVQRSEEAVRVRWKEEMPILAPIFVRRHFTQKIFNIWDSFDLAWLSLQPVIIRWCHGLNVCVPPPPHSYVKSKCHVMVLKVGAFAWWLGRESGVLKNGISVLNKENSENP